MIQAAFTPDALAALTRKPENRAEAFGALLPYLLGRLAQSYSFWPPLSGPNPGPPADAPL